MLMMQPGVVRRLGKVLHSSLQNQELGGKSRLPPILNIERNCYASFDDEYPTHDFVDTETR